MLTMKSTLVAFAVTLLSLGAGCGGDDGEEVSSDEEARRAYLGLDLSIDKAINLGMDGYNAADNANIPDQMTVGDVGGTMTIGGHVDAGSSPNKEMNLELTLVAYTDGPALRVDDDDIDIVYDTDVDPALAPALAISLKDIPEAGATLKGTFTGSLMGIFHTTGDLEGDVTLMLTMEGEIERGPTDELQRTLLTTHVLGVATSGDGTYDVDITL